jgi:hypothetical protein
MEEIILRESQMLRIDVQRMRGRRLFWIRIGLLSEEIEGTTEAGTACYKLEFHMPYASSKEEPWGAVHCPRMRKSVPGERITDDPFSRCSRDRDGSQMLCNCRSRGT